MVAAHPYRRQMPWNEVDDTALQEAIERAARNRAYEFCAGLERINGRGSARENAFSARLCDFMGKPGTAGTDAHALGDIGKCATRFQRRIATLEDLIEELKAGRFEPASLVAESLPVAG
jgi:hypothetical protein